MRAFPAYLCAAANLAAILALATVLAPGTSIVPEPERATYVRDHAALWRAGWSVWILAAISLLLFYRWWSARIGAGRAPLVVATVGFAADVVAEATLIVLVPEWPAYARPAFWLTGAVANGLYTVAGAILTLRTPGVRGPFGAWTWGVWSAGAWLSVSAALEAPVWVAVTTAGLFLLFVPWCVALGRRLA